MVPLWCSSGARATWAVWNASPLQMRLQRTSALLDACAVKLADADTQCDATGAALLGGRAFISVDFPGWRRLRICPEEARSVLQPALDQEQLDATHLSGICELSCGGACRGPSGNSGFHACDAQLLASRAPHPLRLQTASASSRRWR